MHLFTHNYFPLLQMVESNPSLAHLKRHHVPTLCKMLRRLVQGSSTSAGYDVSGVCNPFLQVKILRLLRHLGE